MSRTFESFTSVQAAERAEKAAALQEIQFAVNNHADNLVNLNDGYTQQQRRIQKLEAQMSALLDGVAELTRRVEQKP